MTFTKQNENMKVLLAWIGLALLSAFYVWYTLWIMITVSGKSLLFRFLSKVFFSCLSGLQPMVSARHWVHNFFPDRYWGLAVPIWLGVCALSVACGVYARIMTADEPDEHRDVRGREKQRRDARKSK